MEGMVQSFAQDHTIRTIGLVLIGVVVGVGIHAAYKALTDLVAAMSAIRANIAAIEKEVGK